MFNGKSRIERGMVGRGIGMSIDIDNGFGVGDGWMNKALDEYLVDYLESKYNEWVRFDE